jgi:hypothetical protein
MKQCVEWLVNNYMAHSYIISPLRMLIFTVRAVFVSEVTSKVTDAPTTEHEGNNEEEKNGPVVFN